jgi:hypothetical protein
MQKIDLIEPVIVTNSNTEHYDVLRTKFDKDL